MIVRTIKWRGYQGGGYGLTGVPSMDKPSKSEKMMQLPVVSLFSSYKSLKFEIQTKN